MLHTMKKLLPTLLTALCLLASCSTDKQKPLPADTAPHFDVAFASTYNERNLARADSAFIGLDSLSASDQAYLALFYNNASDNSFENSQRFMDRALQAYETALKSDSLETVRAFELYGKEFQMSGAEISALFNQRVSMLEAGGDDVPEYTLEKALQLADNPG